MNWTALTSSETRQKWLVGILTAVLTAAVTSGSRLAGTWIAERREAATVTVEHREWLTGSLRTDAQACRARLEDVRWANDSLYQVTTEQAEALFEERARSWRLGQQLGRLRERLAEPRKVRPAPPVGQK